MDALATTAIPTTLPTFNLFSKDREARISPPIPPRTSALTLATLPFQIQDRQTVSIPSARSPRVLAHIPTAAVPAAKQLNLMPDSVPLEIWEGTVQDIDVASQTMRVILEAKLSNIPVHSGEIALQWVADQDKNLVVPGAVFYLTLYKQTRRGSIHNVQDLRFRRRPGWSKLQIDQIKIDAALLASKIRPSNS